MTVKKLIDLLSKMDGNRIVVLSSDAEGNGYAEAREVDDNARFEDGEIGLEKLTATLEHMGYGEEDVKTSGRKCVVIWP